MSSRPSRPSVLFITNSENGQSNVVLAVAYELLKSNNINIHVASWPALEPRLAKVSAQVASENASLKIEPIIFHQMPLRSIHDAIYNAFRFNLNELTHKPGWKGFGKMGEGMAKITAPYTPEEHLEIVKFCAELAGKIEPDLVLIDPICSPAHE